MNDNPLTIIAPSPTNRQFESFADACILFARVSSILVNMDDIPRSRSSAVNSCVETTYFLVIFLCHFLIAQLSNHITHPLKTLVIYTFTLWLKYILHDLVKRNDYPELACLLPICALRNACHMYVFTFPCLHIRLTYYGMQYLQHAARICISPFNKPASFLAKSISQKYPEYNFTRKYSYHSPELSYHMHSTKLPPFSLPRRTPKGGW